VIASLATSDASSDIAVSETLTRSTASIPASATLSALQAEIATSAIVVNNNCENCSTVRCAEFVCIAHRGLKANYFSQANDGG
jgi:hypothetical protein